MGRVARTLASAITTFCLVVLAAPLNAAQPAPVVLDRAGAIIKSIGPGGQSVSTPPQSAPPQVAPRNPGVQRQPAGGSNPSEPSASCALDGVSDRAKLVVRDGHRDGLTIDACGRFRDASGNLVTPSTPSSHIVRGANRPAPNAATVHVTIDSMSINGFSYGFLPVGSIGLIGSAGTYFLSDGSSWSSGAGSFYAPTVTLDHVEVLGSTVRYFFKPPSDGIIFQQTDYDGGDHSAQGTLKVAGPLVLEAQIGSRSAVMHGEARLYSNDATWYGEPRFNYYTALVGSIVPFQNTYTLYTSYSDTSQAWTADIFTRSFNYSSEGVVDFVHPDSVPRLVELKINGPNHVPDESAIQFSATARFEGSALRDVTDQASWSVSPAAFASVDHGLLTTNALTTSEETLDLHASYTQGDVTLDADKAVVSHANLFADVPSAWPMYQADSRHSGYLPIALDPAKFSFKWKRTISSTYALNPVTAADGRVFCSLLTYFNDTPAFFALDATNGSTLWSKGYGRVFSVNPPSYAYGNAYIQTGNHESDTWLHAYDAASGELVFETPHSAQWERYFAPTIYQGKVYVDGGTYGGMYGFDAFAGNELWFSAGLQQYDQWTPAVSGDFAYAYLGSYSPGLYAVDRATGTLQYTISDPNFEWDGWSMNVAPVLGTHDDIVTAHDGRLLSFDLASHLIRFEVARGFNGQPSVAHDAIYAIDGGKLAVLDEVTHADQWSWQPALGGLHAPVIVTDSHAFAASEDSVFAIDLATHARVWSYPASGWLALGNGALYVASADGSLTAITVGSPTGTVIAHAGRDTTVECASENGRGTAVKLDGRGSVGAGATFHWSAAGVTFDDATSPTPTGWFPAGTTPVALEVRLDTQVSRDTVQVTVRDTQAPNLTLSLSPTVLWPPNHRMVPVHATVTSADGCDANPTIRLISVTANEGGEADQTGAGAIEGAALGTADFDFALRAERSGNGSGRVYTVCFEVSDASGNRAQQCANVIVPHDRASRLGVAPVAFAAEVLENPAFDHATLRYGLPVEGPARLSIYDVTGRVVARLVDENQPAGMGEVLFAGNGRHGTQLYFYRLEWAGQVRTGKFVIVN